MNLHLDELNTFGKGEWFFVPSLVTCPQFFEENCSIVSQLFQGTDVCLKDLKYISKYLSKEDFFVFVDTFGKPQIVGNTTMGKLEYFRGVCDGYEQTISDDFLDVANEFLSKNSSLFESEQWRNQINWHIRLKNYEKLFNQKRYSEIDVEKLIDDLAYNGYSLHYKVGQGESVDDKIYYPQVKRNLVKQPMLKPMIAKHLGCETNEIFIGKYYGNGKNVKYVIGHLLSSYLHKNCKIKTVFGSLKIKNYKGEFNRVDEIDVTQGFEIVGWNPDMKIFNGIFDMLINIDDDNEELKATQESFQK